jgi:uncharacterized protein (DUF3820 family)
MTALVCAVRAAVPRSSVGAAMALVGLLAWIGMGAGGYQAGLCFDLTGDYALGFANAAVAGLGNLGALAVLALLIHRRRAAQRAAAPVPAKVLRTLPRPLDRPVAPPLAPPVARPTALAA